MCCDAHQVWKSGGITVDYRSNIDTPDSSAATPRLSSTDASSPVLADGIRGGIAGGDGGVGGAKMMDYEGGTSVVTVQVVFAPHQLVHNRGCVEQASVVWCAIIGRRVSCFRATC